MTKIEKAILMITLDDHRLVPVLLENIKDRDIFQDEECRKIYDVIENFTTSGVLPAFVAVQDALKEIPDRTWGQMAESIITIPQEQRERFLIESIERLIWMRKKKKILKSIYDEIENPVGKPQNVISLARELEVIGMKKENPDYEIANREYIAWVKSGGTGIKLGFPLLDHAIDSFNKGELCVIGGRPTTGKTWFAFNVIQNMLRGSHETIGLFSLEMAKPTVVERQKEIFFGLSRYELKNVVMNESIRDEEFMALYHKLNLYTRSYSVSEISRIAEDEGLDIVVVDFINIIRAEAQGGRYEKTTQIILDLKRLAKEQSVLVIVLAQLSRLAGDGSIAVSMDMIRDSGAIEEVSDFIFGLSRPEIAEHAGDEWKGIVCIRLLKNKRGSTINVRAYKDPQCGKMRETTHDNGNV